MFVILQNILNTQYVRHYKENDHILVKSRKVLISNYQIISSSEFAFFISGLPPIGR